MLTPEELEEIEKSNEQFKKDEQVRMLIWIGFVVILFLIAVLILQFAK